MPYYLKGTLMPSGRHLPDTSSDTVQYEYYAPSPARGQDGKAEDTLSVRGMFETAGAAAGIIALVGVVVLYLTTRSALANMAEQTVALVKAVPNAPPNPAISVAFNPFAGLGLIFTTGGLFFLLFVVIVGLLIYIVRMNRKTTS